MLRSAGALGALCVLLLAVAPVARAGEGFPEPPFDADEITRPGILMAVGIVEAAQEEVERRWPACRRRAQPPDPSLLDPPTPVEAAAAFGVLRRAQTPEEAAIVRDAPPGITARSSLRILRALPGGERVQMSVLSAEPRAYVPRPSAVCRAREAREVRRLARARSRAVRRAVRSVERLQAAEDRRDAAPPAVGPHVSLGWIEDEVVGVGASAAAPLARVRARGLLVTARRRGRTLVLVVVPDGVARVEIVLARGRSPVSGRIYRSALRASGAVVDGLTAIPVRRAFADTVVVRQRWLAADGGVAADIDCPAAGC